MDILNHSLINPDSMNAENSDEILFGVSNKGNEPSSSLSTETVHTFAEEYKENAASSPSEKHSQNFHLAEHLSRSRVRNGKPILLSVHSCNDCLPPLESEQQFRIAMKRCARGGDSMERNSSNGDKKVICTVPSLSPVIFKTKPVIISSSPTMKVNSSVKAKSVERRKTAAEVDAFFTRLSTPKHVKGKVPKQKTGNCMQQVSIAQQCRCEATKGLYVRVIRTRSNSTARSGNRRSGLGV